LHVNEQPPLLLAFIADQVGAVLNEPRRRRILYPGLIVANLQA